MNEGAVQEDEIPGENDDPETAQRWHEAGMRDGIREGRRQVADELSAAPVEHYCCWKRVSDFAKALRGEG